MTSQPRKLYRSQSDRIIGGVCGGIAEYLELDPTVVRVLWILLTLLGGSGIILYLISLFIIPNNPNQTPVPRSSGKAITFIGGFLIILGALLFMENMDLFDFHDLWRGIRDFLLPGLLILLGAYLLLRARKGESAAPSPPAGVPPASSQQKRLQRSLYDRKLFGVCGGLAEYFEIDSSIVRLLFVIFTLLSFGFGMVAYLILFLVMPEPSPEQKST